MEVNCVATVYWELRLVLKRYGSTLFKDVERFETEEEALKRKEELEKIGLFKEVKIVPKWISAYILNKYMVIDQYICED